MVNQKFHLNEKVLFQNNKSGNGTGIYISDHSAVVFGENSYIVFTNEEISDTEVLSKDMHIIRSAVNFKLVSPLSNHVVVWAY